MPQNKTSYKLKQQLPHYTSSDNFSCIDYEHQGGFFAAGDSSGKIWIYEATKDSKNAKEEKINEAKEEKQKNSDSKKYTFYGQFQSHDAGFDYLKSQEVQEKICTIKWLPRLSNSLYLLSTNEKQIKLWKIYERNINKIAMPKTAQNPDSPNDLKLPEVEFVETITAVTYKKLYKDAHQYHINNISVSPNQEQFISSDDLRIHLWNIQDSSQTYNVIDIKPEKMENLREVITKAEYNPHNSQIFLFSTNEGSLKLVDMRISSKYSQNLKVFGPFTSDQSNTAKFFSDVTSSISDIKFSPTDPNHIFTRDYIALYHWDARREFSPLATTVVNDKVVSDLSSLFESEQIFDRFDCALTPDGRCVTGTYGHAFVAWDGSGREAFSFTDKKCESVEFNRLLVAGGKMGCLNVAANPKREEFVVSRGGSLNVFCSSSMSENK